MTADGEEGPTPPPLEAPASQGRSWEEEGDTWHAICLPALNQLRFQPEDFSFRRLPAWVVDDEGFIYVADVGNKRIQKFAP